MVDIIDRRLNPKDKNLGNRQRFIARNKQAILEKVRKSGGISDLVKDGKKISIPSDGIREPLFRHDPKTGTKDMILPGNKEFRAGDLVKRPKEGDGGKGSEASADGDGEDAFTFFLSRDELLNILFDELELPDLVRKVIGPIDEVKYRRAGVTTSGTPNNLDLVRTARASYGRHFALRRPKQYELDELVQKVAKLEAQNPDDPSLPMLREKLDEWKRRRKVVPYIDPMDQRFRHFEKKPEPVAQAVMFCLMDVSGSMGEHEKYLAKLFYLHLHLFLQRKYERSEIVFIRHTQDAKEVDEDAFFNSRETGGTVVSSALLEMLKIVKQRYSPNTWNIYVAQATDGDNISDDNRIVRQLLEEEILPIVQFFAYLEVLSEGESIASAKSNLWDTYLPFAKVHRQFVMRRAAQAKQIYPIFRDLFQKKETKGVAA